MSHGVQTISDPGGMRPIVARWVITADLVLESAAHFGGDGDEVADMVLLRDAREGRPLLPGTSLAGALRGHLADLLGGYYSDEESRVARLFGSARGDESGIQSPLIVFDSLGTLPEEHAIEIRDGVQIDSKRGTAEDRKKFDFEIVPGGTRFPLRFDLIVSDLSAEREMASLLATSLSGLACSEISLGARRSRGFGAVRAERWRALRFDLTAKEGWTRWLLSDHANPIPSEVASGSDLLFTLRRTWLSHELVSYEDKRRRLVIEADLFLGTGILVRSAPVRPDEPDVVHLRSAGRSVLPATSLAGVMRGRALRIARVVREKYSDAERWVDAVFGPRFEPAATGAISLHASHLRITEGLIESGVRVRPSRICIDRFTQGVVPGALFDEEPEYGGELGVRLELQRPKRGETGLLFLVLKDLLSGDLPVGGTSSVGRGVLRGRAVAHLEDGTTLDLDVEQPAQSDAELIDQMIDEFATAPCLGASQWVE